MNKQRMTLEIGDILVAVATSNTKPFETTVLVRAICRSTNEKIWLLGMPTPGEPTVIFVAQDKYVLTKVWSHGDSVEIGIRRYRQMEQPAFQPIPNLPDSWDNEIYGTYLGERYNRITNKIRTLIKG